MVASIIVLALTTIALGVLLFQVLKQQGRILFRLDQLERDAAGVSAPADLDIGTLVHDFQLPDLTGKSISFSDFQNGRVLLIYWNPDCGYCDLLAPHLAELNDALKKNNTEVILASYGDVESNRKMVREHQL